MRIKLSIAHSATPNHISLWFEPWLHFSNTSVGRSFAKCMSGVYMDAFFDTSVGGPFAKWMSSYNYYIMICMLVTRYM